MSAGSHSIGEDEGREGRRDGRTDGGRGRSLNRELVSRWILIMSREKRREERRARSNREFESGASTFSHLDRRRRQLRPAASHFTRRHSSPSIHYYPVTNPLTPPARCHLDLDSGPSSVLSAAPGAPSPLDDFSLGVGTGGGDFFFRHRNPPASC